MLLKAKADPNRRQKKHGLTPLMVASSKGYVDIVKLLLHYGADIRMKRPDSGETAVDIA
eukprot:gene48496-65055_t